MKLEKSMQNREGLENDNRKLRDELQRQSGEQVRSCMYSAVRMGQYPCGVWAALESLAGG